MRFPLLLAALLEAVPVAAQTSRGAAALTGLEDVAANFCGHRVETVDPQGLAAALEGPVGDAIGLTNGDSIIGNIAANDPEAGARMWASTTAGNGGCATVIRILSQPAAATLAEVQ